ncbi:MAG TPA: thiamine pyrophosphate-binding protein [Dehalococcoidales bacterium]|nr:thiamine pyrophosphate-binding protein [Dehalococcoidales bacterium]
MAKITGGQALIEILRLEKVNFVFGVPGATEVVLIDALEDAPDIQYILCLHETAAVGIAEGYTRISGRPGFVNLHTNTGLAAALPLMANALQGGVPLVITAGQQDTRLAAQDPALRADLAGMARPFTRWAVEIHNAADIPLVMRQAFKIALHPPQGPVFVSLPQNLLSEKLDFHYKAAETPQGRGQPDPDQIRQAADLLLSAQSPLMLVEDGVTQNDALAEVTELAELSGSGVYQSWMSDVNFPVNHPLYLGDLDVNSTKTRQLLARADVLVVAGSLFFSQAVYMEEPLLPDGVKVIQIDDDAWQLNKNFPVEVAIECNIKRAISQLNRAYLAGVNPAIRELVAGRTRKIGEESQLKARQLAEKALREHDLQPIAPSRLMQEIKKAVLPGTRIVDDCWSASAILRQTLGFSEPLSYLRARGGGSIGWGLPGALGVKLADSTHPVVCISGDGSAAWSIQSLWTAARYRIPVTFIICANAAYRQVRIMKSRILGIPPEDRLLGSELKDPRIDFCGLANSFGMKAARVKEPAELPAALERAFNEQAPNLVEVYLDDKI